MNFLFGNLTHFGAMAFFALVVSITFAFLSKPDLIERGQIHRVGISGISLGRSRYRLADVSILAVGCLY